MIASGANRVDETKVGALLGEPIGRATPAITARAHRAEADGIAPGTLTDADLAATVPGLSTESPFVDAPKWSEHAAGPFGEFGGHGFGGEKAVAGARWGHRSSIAGTERVEKFG